MHYLYLITEQSSDLYEQTLRAYQNSATPGTIANRARQAKVYVTFAVMYDVNYLHPSRIQAAMYVQFLANTYAAPNTVKNYLSGARSWIKSHKGDDSVFASPEVAAVLSYNIKHSNHVQAQAYPLNLHDVKDICRFIDSNPNVPLAVKPAILIGFSCFLRVSNLLSPSINFWSGPHNLSASDVLPVPNGLVVSVRSTKTVNPNNPILFPVYSVSDTSFCPVAAWHRYFDLVKPLPQGPAFMIDQFTPLTARPLVNIMRLALQSAGNQNYHRVSMHSLRRGGAQVAEAYGASRHSLKQHGTWANDTMLNLYLKPW